MFPLPDLIYEGEASGLYRKETIEKALNKFLCGNLEIDASDDIRIMLKRTFFRFLNEQVSEANTSECSTNQTNKER